jgi:NitT/TauT family transport system permease protein
MTAEPIGPSHGEPIGPSHAIGPSFGPSFGPSHGRRRRAAEVWLGGLLRLLPTLALLAAALVGWETLVRGLDVPSYLVPAPSAVAARWLREPGFFVVEGGVSLAEALGGLVVGGGTALLAGLVMARLRWLERALLPMALVLKMTPVVVLAPLFVLWFGFSPLPRVLIAALLTFFPVLIGTVSGLRAVPAAPREVLASLDATPLQEVWLLRLPAALPHLFAAFKVSATLALLGAVIAEWVGGERGLGRDILLANTNLDTPTTLAGVVTLAAIGVGLVGALTLLERRLVFWVDQT